MAKRPLPQRIEYAQRVYSKMYSCQQFEVWGRLECALLRTARYRFVHK
jgi:hypothetical protein